MSKKYRDSIIRKEALILGEIGIIIGIIAGLGISKIVCSFLDVIVRNFGLETNTGTELYYIANQNVPFTIQVPYFIIVLVIFIVYIIIFISSAISIRKIKKMTPVEAIMRYNEKQTKKEEIASSKAIEKIFGAEGKLAYKNIKKDKSKHRATLVSIIISIVLCLSVNSFISNLFKINEKETYISYTIGLDDVEKQKDTIVNYLEENNLIEDYFINYETSGYVILNENQITDKLKKIIENEVFDNNLECTDIKSNNAKINIKSKVFQKDIYNKILKSVGVSELKEDDVIITNTISKNTKYGKNVPITNFKIGDTLEYEDIFGYNKKLKIVGILNSFDEFSNEVDSSFQTNGLYVSIEQLLNEETLIEITKNANKNPFTGEIGSFSGNMYIITEKADEISKRKNEMNNLVGKKLMYINDSIYTKSQISRKEAMEMIGYTVVRTYNVYCYCKYFQYNHIKYLA